MCGFSSLFFVFIFVRRAIFTQVNSDRDRCCGVCGGVVVFGGGVVVFGGVCGGVWWWGCLYFLDLAVVHLGGEATVGFLLFLCLTVVVSCVFLSSWR